MLNLNKHTKTKAKTNTYL